MNSRRIPTEIYSRVCGYFRPVNQWNKGKQEEFSERKDLRIKNFSAFLCDCGGELYIKGRFTAACTCCGKEYHQG